LLGAVFSMLCNLNNMVTSKKILIIDDDKELREMYAEIFQNKNFQVLQAVDGVEGLEVAIKELPDVIFTGIDMPRMDGFTLIEELQKNPTTAIIPVVISSHMGREEDKDRASALGVKDFIIRGTTRPVEVIARVNVLFGEAMPEYKVEVNPEALDAPKLAKDLNGKSSLRCLYCNGVLELSLQFISPQDRSLKAKFSCSGCGREV
jgi:DNA-binding response OmpR family regulator